MSQCTHMKDLILKRLIEPLSDNERMTLSEHISTCASCPAFESRVSNTSMLDQMDEIKPRRDIKHNLMRHMRSRVQSQRRVLDRIADLFSYRPVFYKVAAAAVLFILFVLAAPPFKQQPHIGDAEYRATVVDTVSLNVININQIIQIVDSQKVGVNLSEDTLLSKILYTL